MALECVPAKQIRRFGENCGKMDFICKKSPVLIGKPSINGPFSLAMFNNQRLCMYIYIYPEEFDTTLQICVYIFKCTKCPSPEDKDHPGCTLYVTHMQPKQSQNWRQQPKTKVRSLIYGSKMWKPCAKLIQIGLLWD